MYGFNIGKADNAELQNSKSNKYIEHQQLQQLQQQQLQQQQNSFKNNIIENENNVNSSFQFKDDDDDNDDVYEDDYEDDNVTGSEEEDEEDEDSNDDSNEFNNNSSSDGELNHDEESSIEEDDDDEESDEADEGNNPLLNSFFNSTDGSTQNMDFLNSQNIHSQSALFLDQTSQLNFEEPPQEEVELPPHACAYCSTHELSTVVKCCHPSCGKWFCNGKGRTKSSHIITHLVKSKHKEISLHPESSFGDTTLECFNCGCKNIFLLGFITAKTESVVVLLCRDPCASGPSKEVNWDMSSWQPLINGAEKAFCSWLVKTPSQHDVERSRQISIIQILRLEEFWKNDPEATLRDIEAPRSDDEKPASTQLAYKDAYEYKEIISPLIELEAKHEKELRESLSQSNIHIEWEQSINKRYTATFPFSRSDLEFKVVPGDELKLQFISHSTGSADWEDTGRVIRIDNENMLSLETKTKCNIDSNKGSYRMEMVWRSTSSERILSAMKSFAIKEEALSSYLYHALLGHQEIPPTKLEIELPTNFHIKNLPRLNESQTNAVNKVLTSPLILSKDQLWNSLISHFKNKNVLVEGSLTNLKPSAVILQKPKKLYGQGKMPIPGQNVNNIYDNNYIDPNYGMSMVYGVNQRFNNNSSQSNNLRYSSQSSQTLYNSSSSSNSINNFYTPSSYTANTGSSYQYQYQQQQQLQQMQQQIEQQQQTQQQQLQSPQHNNQKQQKNSFNKQQNYSNNGKQQKNNNNNNQQYNNQKQQYQPSSNLNMSIPLSQSFSSNLSLNDLSQEYQNKPSNK
ncbi:hypothetical protein DICPUDRAFT_84133 [Dictyostelium purpureum]|uniref:Upf1 domain-containing protein n=1 Tax=Dictyostelium purpureum TaxID=5786 RepID=F1A1P0_DICPU|nr:uncharacterized protein DICPUDRAFT_84133 [Dictyostelium purpureum]EGC29887.1 hypothetical protein DICPUDRAFT_84133 [Dictyostelium purpureum]|eukprot:XP_003293581.1 hypothetical protein DICPUDRAFT_84133 [Dictyostelium purpureum]